MLSVIIFCILLSILTLSKAAFLSLFLCFLFAIKPQNYKYSKILILIIFSLFIFFITFFYLDITDTDFFGRLINTFTESDSSLEIRGYYIFLEANFPQAIFGMGLSKVHELRGYEIHSTFMMGFRYKKIIWIKWGNLYMCSIFALWINT
jgi:hypothetical protein